MESVLNIALMMGLPVIAYILFLRSKILTWGAFEDEVKMPLVGDDLAPNISATRAIFIDAPISEVWEWVIQLGADRGGFFSYAFIEKALGYETQEATLVPEFYEMEVGRIVPASIDESKSFIKFNFPVLAVEPGKSFVLENWGAFVLKEISPTKTRLIVRTHGQETPNLLSKVVDLVGEPLHYIMERRMLMGFKAQAEDGVRLSSTVDNLWLLGIFLSGIGIALMVFIGKGTQSVLLSMIYGVIWLWTLLILDPKPIFSMILFLIIIATTVWLY